MPTQVNVAEIVDNSRIGGFQLSVFALCFFCLAIDGFDVQALGYVAPALMAELGITRAELGPVLSAAPFGVLFGSIVFSILADRIGRRPVLIFATLLFALLTFMTARAQSLTELLVVRAIGGVGMGAIMPIAVALVNEYAPMRSRFTVTMVVASGFTIGAALGGFIAAWMLPQWGWRSVFYFGAAVPVVVVVAMLFRLPESIQFLALKGGKGETLARLLRRIDPAAPVGPDVSYVSPRAHRRGLPFLELLADGRELGTLLLWIVMFMNLLNIYLLQGWLTTFIAGMGIAESTAAMIAAMVQVGGVIGAFSLGPVVLRLGFAPVLLVCGLLASVNIALIGQPWMTAATLSVVVFIAGFCVVGGQSAINTLAASYYPTELRAGGVGAGLGVGRVGAIVGPILVSWLVVLEWSDASIFIGAAVPPLILAIAMALWNRLARPHSAGGAGDVH